MKEICPKCGSKNVVKILYGFPTAEAGKQERKGKIKLGGGCIGDHDPSHYCKDCQHKFGHRKD